MSAPPGVDLSASATSRPWWGRGRTVAALALLLACPAIAAGWIADDHVHRTMLLGSHPVSKDPLFDLFRFASGRPEDWLPVVESGYAWWMSPTLKLAFLRPVTALTHVFDHHVLGPHAALHHLHTLLWAAAAALGVRALLRRLLPSPLWPARVADIAALLWVIDDARWLAATWTAARNGNISLCIGALGACAWLDASAPGAVRPGRGKALAAALLLAALLAGEAAVGVVALLVGWTAVGAPTARPDGVGPGIGTGPGESTLNWGAGHLALRLRGLWPLSVVGAIWVGAWVAGDYGARDSAVYIDPLRQPGEFVWESLWRLPTLVGALLLNLPPDVTATMPGARPLFTAFGLGAGISLLMVLLRALPAGDPRRATALGLAVGGLLAQLPSVATLPSHRVLGVSGVAAAGLLALTWQAVGAGWAASQGPRRWVARALRTLHLYLAPVSALAMTLVITLVSHAVRAWDSGSALADAGGKRVVAVVAPDVGVGLYPAYARPANGLPVQRSWALLTLQRPGLTLTRKGPSTLIAESPQLPLFATMVEGLLAAPDRLPSTGEVRAFSGIRATVEARDAAGLLRVRFDFEAPLEDPRWLLLAPTARDWERWQPIAVGETWRPPQHMTLFGVPPSGDPSAAILRPGSAGQGASARAAEAAAEATSR